MSVVTGRDRDCYACRLVSGVGLIGIGVYVGTMAGRTPSVYAKTAISFVGSGISALGVARIMDWPPFRPINWTKT